MDDQIISQTNRAALEVLPSTPTGSVVNRNTTDFPTRLESLREARGMSKAELAKRSELDPSSITRFEQGSRHPDRETVILLASALVLPMVDRDRLLASAGYRSEMWDDPLLVDLCILLNETTTPESLRDELRGMLKAALAYGKLATLDRARVQV